ncbi:hypothetical protein RHECNPAF_850019 [Rhizobium etli CNPAF512]|nr:hypothetical protein RHECNPAF_850019 [Rhizobium etli CNPAF512]
MVLVRCWMRGRFDASSGLSRKASARELGLQRIQDLPCLAQDLLECLAVAFAIACLGDRSGEFRDCSATARHFQQADRRGPAACIAVPVGAPHGVEQGADQRQALGFANQFFHEHRPRSYFSFFLRS